LIQLKTDGQRKCLKGAVPDSFRDHIATVPTTGTIAQQVTNPDVGTAMAKHPEIIVRLSRPGNDFSILGEVSRALRNAGVPAEEIDKICDMALSATERDLLQICGQCVTLVS
jgi:hypothetical protein